MDVSLTNEELVDQFDVDNKKNKRARQRRMVSRLVSKEYAVPDIAHMLGYTEDLVNELISESKW